MCSGNMASNTTRQYSMADRHQSTWATGTRVPGPQAPECLGDRHQSTWATGTRVWTGSCMGHRHQSVDRFLYGSQAPGCGWVLICVTGTRMWMGSCMGDRHQCVDGFLYG